MALYTRASKRDKTDRRGFRPTSWVAIAALFLAVLTGGSAAASDPWISVSSGSVPGIVTVQGDGWSGTGAVSLYQCSDQPEGPEDFWNLCNQDSRVAVTDDPPWQIDFEVVSLLNLDDPFLDGTHDAWGNGTYDCEAAGATCVIVATEDMQSFRWAPLAFSPIYPTPGAADVVSPPDISNLTDGAPVTVFSAGHRPGTEAMAYVCRGYGTAFPGGCDPIAGSQDTVDENGEYTHEASVPRFVWVNPPIGESDWYDCADGCSLMVASAQNLASSYWEQDVDELLLFRDEPMEKNPSLLSVTKVQVNRMGGITITGLVDCTQAVTEWGQEEYFAGVNINWTARQPIGRRGVVTARYESAILSACNDPEDVFPETPPYPWGTHPPVTSPATWWVYPDVGGKFVAGNIHVEVRATGGSWSPSPRADGYLINGASQWDGRAVKA